MTNATESLPPLGRLYLWATHRLYNELAWSYDLAAWIVSAGRWDRWRRMALDYVAQQPVLEVGFGTGELLLVMAGRGWPAVGIDLSPAMQRQTATKLRRRGLFVPRLQSRVQQLPFAGESFGSVVATFPAEYIVDPASLAEFHRVLKPGGRLVVAGLVVYREGQGLAPATSSRRGGPARTAQHGQTTIGALWSRANRLLFGARSGDVVTRFLQRVAVAGLTAQLVLRDDPPWQVPIIIAQKPL
jgi:SAM-dependent methyltransferase